MLKQSMKENIPLIAQTAVVALQIVEIIRSINVQSMKKIPLIAQTAVVALHIVEIIRNISVQSMEKIKTKNTSSPRLL